jgi:hypothetical protein
MIIKKIYQNFLQKLTTAERSGADILITML